MHEIGACWCGATHSVEEVVPSCPTCGETRLHKDGRCIHTHPKTQGRKDDTGKVRLGLLPTDALREIAKVLTFGAQKYDARNWEKGIAYERVYSALQRHLSAWWEREETDSETGISHLAHAGCCLLFLLTYSVRGMRKFDDRPRMPWILRDGREAKDAWHFDKVEEKLRNGVTPSATTDPPADDGFVPSER